MHATRRGRLEPVLRRSFLLALVYGFAAVIALSLARKLSDPDYGWHFRTGEWTVEHRAVPDLELFSSNPVDERWVAYSWAYDVLLVGMRRLFGIQAQVVLSVALALAITHALFSLVRRLSGRTVLAAGLTGLGVVSMAPMLYGRSTMLSILFALLLLRILAEATVLGRRRAIYLAPLVFVAWANVHVQFLYGLFLYGCFLAQAVWEARGRRERRRFVSSMVAVGAACLAATLVNPYHVRIYDPLLRYLEQAPVIYGSLDELRPRRLSSVTAWTTIAVALLVVAGAARRVLDRPFLLGMFAVAAFVGFRSARDAWFLVATGSTVAAIAYARREDPEELLASPLAVGAGTAVAVAVAAVALDVSDRALEANLRTSFPVGAAEWIEKERDPGPIYNHYDWGGYLMWRLPRFKTSIDGRSYVHDIAYFQRTLRIWRAEPGWREDPELSAATLVVARRGMPLTDALAADPRFRAAYADETAVVYVRSGS